MFLAPLKKLSIVSLMFSSGSVLNRGPILTLGVSNDRFIFILTPERLLYFRPECINVLRVTLIHVINDRTTMYRYGHTWYAMYSDKGRYLLPGASYKTRYAKCIYIVGTREGRHNDKTKEAQPRERRSRVCTKAQLKLSVKPSAVAGGCV